MTKPFLCTLSLCPLLVEQQAYNFLALPLFLLLPAYLNIPLSTPAELGLPPAQAVFLSSYQVFFLLLPSVCCLFFFQNFIQKFCVNPWKSSAIPTFCSMEWIGFVLWRGSPWRSSGLLVGPFGFQSCVLWVDWVKTQVPSGLVTLFDGSVRYIFLGKK